MNLFTEYWGEGLKWVNKHDGGPHEASFLKLDCSRIKSVFGWKPHWNIEKAVQKVVEWTKCSGSGGNVRECMDRQINEYLDEL